MGRPPLLGIVSLQDQPLNVHPNPSCQLEPAPIKMTRSFVYLANEQRSPVPYVQVHGKEEKSRFKTMMEKVLQENISLQNQNVLETLADWWNEQALGSNGIYKKYPEHLALYYKKWRKSQSTKEALRQPDIQEMIDTLENTTGGTICPEITERQPLRTAGTLLPMPSTSDTSKKRARKCKVDGCPDPENCRGRGQREFCPAIAQSKSNNKSRTRRCNVPNCPNPDDCPSRGRRGKEACPAFIPP